MKLSNMKTSWKIIFLLFILSVLLLIRKWFIKSKKVKNQSEKIEDDTKDHETKVDSIKELEETSSKMSSNDLRIILNDEGTQGGYWVYLLLKSGITLTNPDGSILLEQFRRIEESIAIVNLENKTLTFYKSEKESSSLGIGKMSLSDLKSLLYSLNKDKLPEEELSLYKSGYDVVSIYNEVQCTYEIYSLLRYEDENYFFTLQKYFHPNILDINKYEQRKVTKYPMTFFILTYNPRYGR